MDLISRKAAIDALNINGCCGMGITYLMDCDSVPAVPLDKLCEWLSENSSNIPCSSCANFANEYCTAMGDKSRPCPNSADDWRKVITKWMEEQHDD